MLRIGFELEGIMSTKERKLLSREIQTSSLGLIHDDSSIKPNKEIQRLYVDMSTFEYSSHIFNENNIDIELEKIDNIFKKHKSIYANHTCGFHVHFSNIETLKINDNLYAGFTRNHLRSIKTRYALNEDVFALFFKDDRMKNRFCESLSYNFSKNYQYSCNHSTKKYSAINIPSTHNTIEFRQHHGTFDFDEIKMWIKFLIQFIKQSKKYNAPNNIVLDINWNRIARETFDCFEKINEPDFELKMLNQNLDMLNTSKYDLTNDIFHDEWHVGIDDEVYNYYVNKGMNQNDKSKLITY